MSTVFQKYLIPEESHYVRFMMQKAGEYSLKDHWAISHLGSVALSVAAVVMSFFNAFSYLLQIPFSMFNHLVSFHPHCALLAPFKGVFHSARSLIFVSLGVTFIVVGLLVPKALFPPFTPEYWDTLEERLKKENALLRKELDQTKEVLEMTKILLQKQENKRSSQWSCWPVTLVRPYLVR